MFGLSDDEIAALFKSDFERFSASEQALLRLADAWLACPSTSATSFIANSAGIFPKNN
jgi:hypothetical protein